MSNQTPVLTFLFDFDNIVICKKKKDEEKEGILCKTEQKPCFT